MSVSPYERTMQRIERAIDQQSRAVVLEALFCSLTREIKKCGCPGCQKLLGAVEPALLQWLEKPDPDKPMDPTTPEERQLLINRLRERVVKVVDGEYGLITTTALLQIIQSGLAKMENAHADKLKLVVDALLEMITPPEPAPVTVQ